MATKKAGKGASKKAGKKAAKKAGKKTITIRLTAEQRALLEEKTNGVFTEATFTFTAKPIKGPRHPVSCSLRRVGATNR